MATFADIQDRAIRLAENKEPLSESIIMEVPAIINDLIRRAIELHPWKCTETTASFTTQAVTRALGNIPSDWRSRRDDPYYLQNDGQYAPMYWLSGEEEARRLYSEMTTDIGKPKHILERETDFAVYPFSDSGSDYSGGEYRVKVPYYKYLADLSASTDTNWFTTNAVNFLVYGTAGEMLARCTHPDASLWLFSDDIVARPSSITDREFRRLLRKEKLQRLGPDLAVIPKRDVYQSMEKRRFV